MGASGEYFKIADRVILVENFMVSEYRGSKTEMPHITADFSAKRRLAGLGELRELCVNRRVEIKDDQTIKFGAETMNISDIIACPTIGQLSFICSFLYRLSVFGKNGFVDLNAVVTDLYRQIDRSGISLIHQTGFKETGEIEYVRPCDIMCIIYRLRCVRFCKI